MAKIELVRRPHLISPRHLLGYIFFTEMQVDQAAKILNLLIQKDGKIPDSEWEIFVLTSRGLYVKVMRKLRDTGLVEKKMGEFALCEDFSRAISKLSDYWSEIIRSFEGGDRSIRF
ncbi:hypothetical protein EU527_12705 [Candidatus Thorarchaeota archaeon]|nr:MAG: hypothetical protein EU527_12705 [Candidatus Thorarchaeota archaeon]